MSIRLKTNDNSKDGQRVYFTLQETSPIPLLKYNTYVITFYNESNAMEYATLSITDTSDYPDKFNIFYISTIGITFKGWYMYKVYKTKDDPIYETGQVYFFTDDTENEPTEVKYNTKNNDEYYYE